MISDVRGEHAFLSILDDLGASQYFMSCTEPVHVPRDINFFGVFNYGTAPVFSKIIFKEISRFHGHFNHS